MLRGKRAETPPAALGLAGRLEALLVQSVRGGRKKGRGNVACLALPGFCPRRPLNKLAGTLIRSALAYRARD
jgi:hypothetical protein